MAEGSARVFEAEPAGAVQGGTVATGVTVVVAKREPARVQRIVVHQIAPGLTGGVDERTDRFQRKASENLVPGVLGKSIPLADPAADDIDPPGEVKLEAAIGVGNFALPASGSRRRDHAGEVRR